MSAPASDDTVTAFVEAGGQDFDSVFTAAFKPFNIWSRDGVDTLRGAERDAGMAA